MRWRASPSGCRPRRAARAWRWTGRRRRARRRCGPIRPGWSRCCSTSSTTPSSSPPPAGASTWTPARTRRAAGAPARRRPAAVAPRRARWRSPYPTPAPAWRPTSWSVSSSASTRPTGRAPPAARALDWPSPNTWCRPTVAASGPRVPARPRGATFRFTVPVAPPNSPLAAGSWPLLPAHSCRPPAPWRRRLQADPSLHLPGTRVGVQAPAGA